MAIFKSNTMTSASGSVGGTTYSHNRSGMYMRARTIPTNPATNAQQSVRGFFAAASSAWKGLTQAQQDGWGAYANATPRKNALGDTVYLTAQQMYVGVSALNQQLTGSPLLDAPLTPGIAPLGNDLVLAVSEAVDPVLTITGIDGSLFKTASAFVGVYVGRPVSLGRAFYKGPYVLAEAVAGSAGTATATTVTLTGYNTTGGVVQIPIRLAGLDDQGRPSTTLEQLVLPA